MVRLLRNPTALTACSRRLSAILTALSATPSNQKPSCLFHAQREKDCHSVVSLRHRSGDAIYPLKRGLFPRHLRAEKARFFVHARILDGSSRPAGRKGKKSFKKIVQICALLCNRERRPGRKKSRLQKAAFQISKGLIDSRRKTQKEDWNSSALRSISAM